MNLKNIWPEDHYLFPILTKGAVIPEEYEKMANACNFYANEMPSVIAGDTAFTGQYDYNAASINDDRVKSLESALASVYVVYPENAEKNELAAHRDTIIYRIWRIDNPDGKYETIFWMKRQVRYFSGSSLYNQIAGKSQGYRGPVTIDSGRAIIEIIQIK